MNTALDAPPAAVALRSTRAGDEAHLFAVYASTRAGELARVDWNETQKENFLRMQFDAQRRFYESEYPGAEFQIILVANEPAGRLYVHRREREIRIMDIALLPDFRGRGIGTALLNDILAEGGRTARSVTIHVESFNPARRLYERLGFRKAGGDGVYHLLEWKPDGASINRRETA